ncbi:type II toxin-antitoxin system RelE/ParE family toxin [Humisphaera borealis]|uniref:Type II toxin-antitoxin system RelE/ParE family toxin n=1 Tax=Humisphaera borealis TaxID=2807512 RepID=A0A7M2WST7_9BACT|nr:type II toxin-antitoxin system RelE/ParE family toxin [Humisphaera borealis]
MREMGEEEPVQYRVIVQQTAFNDIDRIVDYVEDRSHQGAASVIDMLWKACTSLALLPKRYKVFRPHRDPSQIVRSMPVAPFVIYYRVFDIERVVRVLTVRHGSRRQPKRFP